jgi:hypothetical protein
MRYRLRMLLLLGMVASAMIAASSRCLESRWFADLTGWHGGGGYIVEVFARGMSIRLIAVPIIFATADFFVALNAPADKKLKGFWIFVLMAYSVSLALCNSAFLFAQSARE